LKNFMVRIRHWGICFDEHSFPNKALVTAKTDDAVVRDMLKYFGDISLLDVTPQKISAYKIRCMKRGFAPATTNYRLKTLKHAFSFAIREWEWVSENPLWKVRLLKVRNARDRWLSFEEEKALLDACIAQDNEAGWLHDVVIFALNTGMRQDEILSLQWHHVDLFRKTAAVVRSKNGEKRTMPLNNRIFVLFKAKVIANGARTGYVFQSGAGTKIEKRNLRRGFLRALKRARITDFRFHDLRHTFATRLAQEGVDLYKVSKLLGHKDIKMTQRYAHHYSESLRDGVEVLDKSITFLSQYSDLEQKNGDKSLKKMVRPDGFEPPTL